MTHPREALFIAAQRGDVGAQAELGCLYLHEKNFSEGVKWTRLAAEAGEPTSQHNLGHAYFYGYGVPQNILEAARWFVRAAVQGHADSQNIIGYQYWEDPIPEAPGEEYALLGAGTMYAFGATGERDTLEAFAWFFLAGKAGYKGFSDLVETLNKQSLSEDEEKIKKRSSELEEIYLR